MARVHLTPQAREWLGRRGRGSLLIRQSRRNGCCGGHAQPLVAEPGEPTEPEGYRRLEVDGFTVYLVSALDDQQTLTVHADGLFGFRRLFVEGAGLSTDPE